MDHCGDSDLVIMMMGVAGAGKTTIGRLLAEDLGWPFYEGDDFHPQSNVDKMSQGIPLTDKDRWPWLDAILNLVNILLSSGRNAVIASSSLTKSYRRHLQGSDSRVVFVYLKGDYQLIGTRLEERAGHFMKADLLESQFRILEEPESGTTQDIAQRPEQIVNNVKHALGL